MEQSGGEESVTKPDGIDDVLIDRRSDLASGTGRQIRARRPRAQLSKTRDTYRNQSKLLPVRPSLKRARVTQPRPPLATRLLRCRKLDVVAGKTNLRVDCRK